MTAHNYIPATRQPPSFSDQKGFSDFSGRLSRSVLRHLGPGHDIESLRRLSGGASQESWAFDAVSGAARFRLLLRRVPQVIERKREVNTAAGSATEARLMQLMKTRDVPVPTVRWILDEADDLGSGFVMDWLDGETIGRKIVREGAFAAVKPGLAFHCGEILARIHTTPRSILPKLRTTLIRENVEGLYREYERQQHRRPVFEITFQWLRANIRPARQEPTLVHGDFRTGNYILGEDGMRAILDWEIAHLGDPIEDLGWFCIGSWRFGQLDLPAGGIGTREQLFAGYESAGGGKVDPEAVRFWEVYGSLNWAISCVEFAREFQRGDRSVERASIGRRASENEIDLLRLLNPRGER